MITGTSEKARMLAQRLEAVHPRHGDVEQDDIRLLLLDQVERGLAVVGADAPRSRATAA